MMRTVRGRDSVSRALCSAVVALVTFAGCTDANSSGPLDHRFDKQATHNIETALHLDFHESMYEAAKISGNACVATLKREKYDGAGSDGQRTIQAVLKRACAASYTFLKDRRRAIPNGGLHIVINDRAGGELFSDVVLPGSSPTRVSVVTKRHPAVPFTVVDHYVWSCSSNGGFGEKAIINSHKQSDLGGAVKEWMAANATDKSVCLHFEVYSTAESFDAAQHPSHYTDDQLERIPYGAQYTNNPNTHYEGWTDPDGKEHILHAADS